MCDTSQRDGKRNGVLQITAFCFLTVSVFGGDVFREEEAGFYSRSLFHFSSSHHFFFHLLTGLFFGSSSAFLGIEWFEKGCLGGSCFLDAQETTVKIDVLFGASNIMVVASFYYRVVNN